MFYEDEERISDIYQTPHDRVKETSKHESIEINDSKEEGDIVLDLNSPRKIEKSVRDSSKEVGLSKDDLLQKRKKRRFIGFILFVLMDLALLGYIIYLVVSIFMNIGK